MTTLVNKNYFDWLIGQITVLGEGPRSYFETLTQMYETEFVWTIPGDDNRCQDGKDLRTYFSEQSLLQNEPFPEYVSVLEVLVALSRKVAFAAGGDSEFWAWQLMVHLGLEHYPDPLTRLQKKSVTEILQDLVWRQYDPNGFRGFFPLIEPLEDQRRVEIWKQMQAFVNEINEPN